MIRKFTNILKPPVVTPFVKLSEVGSAGVITLDRKDAMNALSYEMVIACYEAFKDLEGRKKLVIIKSSSDKVFSAGGDIKELSASSVERVKHALGTGYRGCHLIHTYKIPFIALINGTAVGAASIFTMGAKYRVSTEKTIFRMPETQFGFFNDSCASYFLSRLERNVGIYLGLTGAPMDGYDVKRFGLSTHYVDSKYLRELEKCLTICDTHDDVLNCLDEFAPSRSNYESRLDENLDRIEKCFSGLTVQQIIDNLKHDGSEWALDTIKTLRRMSPTSLKVCHRLLNMGRYMSVEDCARLEWRLAAHFATKSDLQEGVRALMSDKDKKPKWNPATIEEVSDWDVRRFFGPLPDGDELKFEIKRSSEGFYVA